MAGLLGHLSSEDALALAQGKLTKSATKSCTYCGAQMPDHYKFCGQCGVAFDSNTPPHIPAEKRYCPECGKPAEEHPYLYCTMEFMDGHFHPMPCMDDQEFEFDSF